MDSKILQGVLVSEMGLYFLTLVLEPLFLKHLPRANLEEQFLIPAIGCKSSLGGMTGFLRDHIGS